MPATPGGQDAISELIDRDEAYDSDPSGDPPLLVARYRAALRAALRARQPAPDGQAQAWTQRERDAYLAGGEAARQAVVSAMATAILGTEPEPPGTERAAPEPPDRPTGAGQVD
ncbi:hypothetical protein CcI49_24430 [Frankia sp. CcI49]|uniref:hypothetical protein n=1 Tax=unclassified Frankia TaxID=2632575 RepID=UPI0006CA127D|nr:MULTISPECIES: hypothetical protein [unclassified Frankia]KPM50491.1 hypothetical protein ACG83_39985 [Frankia sp. R43]ONH58060.1 hypothetical protein CcI49_24430 [Frankia sp. CcI49]